jgi:TPR repeat protein
MIQPSNSSQQTQNTLFLTTRDEIEKEEDDEIVVKVLLDHYERSPKIFSSLVQNQPFELKNERLTYLLGRVYLEKKDLKKGLTYLVLAGSRGHVKSACLAIEYLLSDLHVMERKDAKSEVESLLKTISWSDVQPHTLLKLAKIYLEDDEKQKALSLFFYLADLGNQEACYHYAELLPQGQKDVERLSWYKKAGDHKEALAKVHLILEQRNETLEDDNASHVNSKNSFKKKSNLKDARSHSEGESYQKQMNQKVVRSVSFEPKSKID